LVAPFVLPKIAVLVALPRELVLFVFPQASGLAGVTGGVLGLVLGLGLAHAQPAER
jgi:hypothetical protein